MHEATLLLTRISLSYLLYLTCLIFCRTDICGWTTLSKRRQQHKLSFMYKVNNGIVPSYIQDLIPLLVSLNFKLPSEK